MQPLPADAKFSSHLFRLEASAASVYDFDPANEGILWLMTHALSRPESKVWL